MTTTRTRAAACLAGAALLGPAATAAEARPQTTVVQTIEDRDRDNRLEPGPGEAFVRRTELGTPARADDDDRVSRLVFVQLTDSHVLDEESPLRVEYLDRLGPPLTSAYRPQEGLTPQIQESMVDQVRNLVGPASRRRVELVMTTGDNTDNTQLNETRWFIDLLDGGKHIDPDSGVPGTCGTPPGGRRYDGVRDQDEYYEPDASGPPGANAVDGPGYSPDQAENLREAGRSNSVRDFPALLERMNEPFHATGLDVPWYGIFGNHDGLILGNQPRNPALEAIATGCVKVRGLSDTGLAAVQDAITDGGGREEELPGLDVALGEATAALMDPGAFSGTAVTVPLDPRRRPLRKAEYIAEHFRTTGRPVGHGFTPANLATGQGNYAFSPKPGLRFLVLDSMNEAGGPDGNIDDTQFRWIHQELLAAEARKEVVMAFAHHSLRTQTMPPVSPFPPGDQGGDYSPLVHFGETRPGEQAPAPCLLQDPATPPTPDETLRCLFLRHPSVVAFLVGHEHRNRVVANERRPGTGPAEGGFWEITTASHVDWPQQSRAIDLVDNRDGTLSIFSAMVDHAAAPNPGAGRASASVERLASIGRELAFNDPDAENGEDGRPDARGTRADRNVELVVRDPYGAG